MCGGAVRFRKSRRSGGESNCVELAADLRKVRDSKCPDGGVLDGVDVRQLIGFARRHAIR
ncbi:MAG TPA: DUF397 domain-containing protein [Actinophytocola sp.]|uniref:DUF397 domain-containing protein n=1 Tax=Actinophytocola sp. TaxID=1872138 RepID=UPI002DDCF879|nr:DUF397 domain-containing protein [Actinophytocola sp.]HEV2779662.1 DUF397 domain-containing protein [Actinophytocola sp.]